MFIQLNAEYKTLYDIVLRMQYDYDTGLTDFRQKKKKDEVRNDDEEQILELKRRSNYRMIDAQGDPAGEGL